MLPKKYFDLIFILIMGFGMSLLMTLIITYINTGMDKDYINRFFRAWVVSLPIAIIAALILGPPIKKLVDKIQIIMIMIHFLNIKNLLKDEFIGLSVNTK